MKNDALMVVLVAIVGIVGITMLSSSHNVGDMSSEFAMEESLVGEARYTRYVRRSRTPTRSVRSTRTVQRTTPTTGSPKTTLSQAPLPTCVNVQDYGALPYDNSAVDDAIGINAAIAAAANNGLPVCIPEGTFWLKSDVHLKSGITMYGKGENTLLRTAIIGVAPLRLHKVSNVNIKDMNILHITKVGDESAIMVTASSNVVFDNVNTNRGKMGYYLQQGTPINNNIVIKNCEVQYAHRFGIWFEQAKNSRVENCELHHNLYDGVKFSHGPVINNVIRGNHMHNNGRDGFDAALLEGYPGPLKDNVIEYNIAEKNDAIGIALKRSTKAKAPDYDISNTIRFNIVRDNPWGIELMRVRSYDDTYSFFVHDNVVYNNGEGIILLNSYYTEIYNNWVHDNTEIDIKNHANTHMIKITNNAVDDDMVTITENSGGIFITGSYAPTNSDKNARINNILQNQ